MKPELTGPRSGRDAELQRRRPLPWLLILGLICFLLTRSEVDVSGNHIEQDKAEPSTAQAKPPEDIWRSVDAGSLSNRAEQSSPNSFRVVELNEQALSRVLAETPMEFTEKARTSRPTITLPLPDGSFARFRVEESPAMEPELAARFPEVRSYRGQGIDDPAATARFDWSPNGFHGIVLGTQGTAFIDPYTAGDTKNYICFYKEDLQDGFQSPRCEVTEAMQASTDLRESVTANTSVGTSLRTYRLAIATTVEYTNNATYGGTKASTLTKLNTIVNLINAIYEHEVAIRFQLVAGELSVIFDTEPDGLTNSSVNTMLNESPTVLNAAIGSGAYDIGHAFGLSSAGSSSGVAQLGVVCGGSKGRGASVLGIALVTGNFAIDSGLVAHEWGHQFSAAHTFNSVSNICGTAGQRNASTAFEPGSGSTLMAYPGSCSPENLQSNSDSYFHAGSFDQIAAYSAGSGACAAGTSTGNNPPTVSAGPDFSIPKSTPFTLTATASDPDGDPLTYSWEELDVGAASPPMTDDGTRPLFRSFLASASASRTCPKLSDILNNTSTIGELLPTTTRAMNFRVTARDNRAAGSGVNSDNMVLNVTSAAGPFVVTAPNTATSWTGGTSQTVTWNVANTTSTPVSCANVKISLSTNGGTTFPIVIAASTPNDGSELITVPNNPSTSARIKVEAVGNIFFDVSNTNFTIVQGTGGGAGADTIGVYLASNRTFYLRNSNSQGFADSTVQYGPPAALPLVGDWDGNGTATIGAYDPATQTFYLRNSNTPGFADISFRYGPPGAVPLAGDWNGDGTTTIAVYDPSSQTFYLRNSNSAGFADITIRYGPPGAVPIVGDWNGDGTTTIGVYDPTSQTFYLRNSNTIGNADLTIRFGPAGATPVAGDWDANGTVTLGVYDPTNQTFYLRNSNTVGFADLTIRYGPPAGTPLAGDWDGL